MLVQVTTDNHIQGSESLTEHVESVVAEALSRFAERITRVNVHLTDENSSAKHHDDDKRCVMEARLAGMKPISISHQDASLGQAIDGAAEKLSRAIERAVARESKR